MTGQLALSLGFWTAPSLIAGVLFGLLAERRGWALVRFVAACPLWEWAWLTSIPTDRASHAISFALFVAGAALACGPELVDRHRAAAHTDR
jgi:hypothetical protein